MIMRTPLLALGLAMGLSCLACKRQDLETDPAPSSESTEAPAQQDPAQKDPEPQEPGSKSIPADSGPTAEGPVPLPDPPAAKEPAPPSPEDLEAKRLADEARKRRAAKLFGRVIDPLTEASKAYEEHESLDKSSWFGKDQSDNQKRINQLLDEAIEVLQIAEIEDARQTIRNLEEENAGLLDQMVKDREARLAAPTQEELNRLQKTYTMSREEYDARIDEAAQKLSDNKEAILRTQLEFVQQMRGIGVELDLESAQSLLSTVTGDDFVKMCVVFDNVRGVTVQLQELTEASGESLEAAKRYYGSYVVLIRLLDHVQKDFIRRAREEMIPQLAEYRTKAEKLIVDAQNNMAAGGDRTIGEQNIRSNELTIQAARLYTDYLHEQADEIEQRNQQLQIALRDAENTFDTVALSSEVATLLKEGSRNFAALLRLDLPPLRGFENAELKAEFERLTERMGNIQ